MKQHDNLLKILQDRAEEKKEREILLSMVRDLKEEVKFLVSEIILHKIRILLNEKKISDLPEEN